MRIPFLGENHSDIGGTKMKRIAAILLAVLALVLGSKILRRGDVLQAVQQRI